MFKFSLFADVTITDNELGNLWILGIGINSYKNNSIPYLHNPVNDTRKLINSLESLKGIHFKNIYSLILTDENATKENILNNFNYFNQVKNNDTVLLYINAHGISSTFNFMYDYVINTNKKLEVIFTEIQHPKLFIPPNLKNPVYFGRKY